MFIIDYVAKNFVMLAELAGLTILLGISVHVQKRTVVLTRIALCLILISSILIAVEDWTASFETLSIWRPILTAAVYSIQPFILLMMMLITVPQKRGRIWILIPAIVSIPLYFTSQWTHFVCWFTDSNSYAGGPLSILPYVVFGFYLVVFLVQTAIYFNVFHGQDRASVLYVILIPVSGVVLYYFMDYTNDYSAIFTSAILLYYLFLYIHMAKTDALTGLMNRHCFYRDVKSNRQKISGVLSVDMNELKWLNDTIGHDAGDRALKTVSDILMKKSGRQRTAYRIGGDEFTVLYFGQTESEIKEDVERMRLELNETPYVCAFGYAIPASDEPFDDVLRRADQHMYENKSDLKRQVLENGGSLHRRHDD
ncbi:MAG: diguanylate cyclase [Lentisphaeria bacterium]|nr:diguanylate cyclase [Lentisphaeria bacterium]